MPSPSASPAQSRGPVEAIPGDPATGILVLCDHASNRIPRPWGSLGLPAPELQRHIAYDIGAGPLARALAGRLGAPALLSTFSRLLIDPNRGEDDPTLIMRLSDGAIIPGNHPMDRHERERRITLFHRPYQEAIEAAIVAAADAGQAPILVSIHSYTPVWRGVPRAWQTGILWDSDPRLAKAIITGLSEDPALVVGDNEPYDGALKNDTMYRHGTRRGLAHAIIEVRQDLNGDDAGVAEWADRLAPILTAAAADPEIRAIRFFGSRTGPVDTIST